MAEQEQSTPKNIFPLHLLKVCENTEIMVEVKSGQTFNGILKGVDKYMNLKLVDAVLTDPSGKIFHQVPQVYIRGNTLKYFSLEENCIRKIEGTEYKGPEKWKNSQNKAKVSNKKK